MRTVGTFEAKTHLSELLDVVAGGEAIVITRNGTPIAELRPYRGGDPDRARLALESIRAFRARVRPDPAGKSILEYVAEGRRH